MSITCCFFCESSAEDLWLFLEKPTRYCCKLLNQWETTLRPRDGEVEGEREGRLLNKTSWDHFHVSPYWLGWSISKLDLSSRAAKAPSNQQLLLRRSGSPKHNQHKGNLFKQELISHGLVTANTDTDSLGDYSHKSHVSVLQLTSTLRL